MGVLIDFRGGVMRSYNKLIKGALVFLLYILVPYVLNMFFPSITASSRNELLCRFGCMFLLLLFFILVYKDDLVRDIKAFCEKPLSFIGKSVKYFAILLVILTSISATIFAVHPDFVYTNSSIIDLLIKDHFVIMLFYVFIISLFTEQIVFRKVFRDILQNKYFYIIFSGIIYGIFQVGYNISSINDVFTIIPFAFAGIILSTAYDKTDNILTPCFVYMFYDLFLLIGSLI